MDLLLGDFGEEDVVEGRASDEDASVAVTVQLIACVHDTDFGEIISIVIDLAADNRVLMEFFEESML